MAFPGLLLLLTIMSLVGQLPILVGGAVIMENIFNLPGLGRLLLTALNDRDYPMVSGINLFFATGVVGINLLVDLTAGLPLSWTPGSAMTDFLRRLVKEKPLSIIAGVVILLLILVAIFADVLAPFPHDEVNIVDRMQAPSGRYLLGTDQLGRDLLSRLIFGAQISLTVGLAATARPGSRMSWWLC